VVEQSLLSSSQNKLLLTRNKIYRLFKLFLAGNVFLAHHPEDGRQEHQFRQPNKLPSSASGQE
jgi:hypothetical protein